MTDATPTGDLVQLPPPRGRGQLVRTQFLKSAIRLCAAALLLPAGGMFVGSIASGPTHPPRDAFPVVVPFLLESAAFVAFAVAFMRVRTAVTADAIDVHRLKGPRRLAHLSRVLTMTLLALCAIAAAALPLRTGIRVGMAASSILILCAMEMGSRRFRNLLDGIADTALPDQRS